MIDSSGSGRRFGRRTRPGCSASFNSSSAPSSSSKRMNKPRERGAVAVEFALLTPVFLLILGLLVDFSRIGFVQISLNSAAREGVRSSSFGLSTTDITTTARSASGGAARIAQLSTNGTVTVTQVRSCSASTTLGRTTEVSVSTAFNWVTPVKLFTFMSSNSSLTKNLVLQARGVMVCAG